VAPKAAKAARIRDREGLRQVHLPELGELVIRAAGPFALADSSRTRTLLASAGFSNVKFEALHEPM
jgi:hypothetical protein